MAVYVEDHYVDTVLLHATWKEFQEVVKDPCDDHVPSTYCIHRVPMSKVQYHILHQHVNKKQMQCINSPKIAACKIWLG